MPGPDDIHDAAAVVAAVPVAADISPQSAEPVAPDSAQPDLVDAASPAAVVDPAAAAADALPEAPATLLEQHDAKVAEKATEAEVKPDVEKPAEEPKPDEAKPSDGEPEVPAVEEPAVAEPVALEPVDYFHAETGIKLPETILMDDALKGSFTTALDLLRAEPAKGAQALVDLHAKTMQDYADHMASEQWRVFREMNEANVIAIMADPILGGAGHDTAMAQVATARDMLASRAEPGTPKYEQELAEFNQMLKNTGAGNHPAMLRFLHNAGRVVQPARQPPPNPLPPKDLGRNPAGRSKALQYDNPTSQT